jgi:hypothetical protein
MWVCGSSAVAAVWWASAVAQAMAATARPAPAFRRVVMVFLSVSAQRPLLLVGVEWLAIFRSGRNADTAEQPWAIVLPGCCGADISQPPQAFAVFPGRSGRAAE